MSHWERGDGIRLANATHSETISGVPRFRVLRGVCVSVFTPSFHRHTMVLRLTPPVRQVLFMLSLLYIADPEAFLALLVGDNIAFGTLPVIALLSLATYANKIPPTIPNHRLNLLDLPQDPRELFRFSVSELLTIVELLGLGSDTNFRTSRCHYRFTGIEGLCIVLRKLAFPARWNDTVCLFGRSKSALSEIFNCVIRILVDEWQHLFTTFPDGDGFSNRVLMFMQACIRLGSPLQSVIGFIDGTLRQICRPIWFQNLFYNGKDGVHGLKYLGLSCPDGIMYLLFGPFLGPDHDGYLQANSELVALLRELMDQLGETLYVYADSAFSLTDVVIKGFLGAALTDAERRFNRAMSELRISIEHAFGLPLNLFWSLDFVRQNKFFAQPVAETYMIACLFANLFTCFNGNTTSRRFGVTPPTARQYLRYDTYEGAFM
jgi:nuclease HARBI1